MILRVINADENHAIVCQKIFCACKPRINHRAPLRMKSPIRLMVDLHPVPVLIHRAALFFVLGERLAEVVVVHEIVPRIIRRIDIDHLDLPEITLLQQLQRLEIIPFDIEVLRRVPVLALLDARAQRLADRAVRFDDCCLLADPGEFVGFLALAHMVCKHLPQLLEINRLFKYPPVGRLSLCDAIWEQRRQFFEIFLREIRRFHLHLIHAKVPPVPVPTVSSRCAT